MIYERVPIQTLDHTPAEFVEDLPRYRFAGEHVRGSRVVDLACGTGYGTRLLADAGAAHVLGVDLSDEALTQARQCFGDSRIEFRKGDGASIPVESGWADAAISLETIEHVAEPARFLRELRRVLRPGGVLVMSTPRNETEGRVRPTNPFHVREYSEDEFVRLVRREFDDVELWSQITDYDDDLPVARWMGEDGTTCALPTAAFRPLRRAIPNALKRRVRRSLGSRGLHPVASRIVPGSHPRAAVQIAVAR